MPKTDIEFSKKDRIKIRKLAGYGLRDEDIANIFDVAESTLKKYCKDDLKKGRSKAFLDVAKTGFQLAVTGKYPPMTMFWLKTRGHGQFKEVQYIDESGGEEENKSQLDLKKLSKDDLKKYYELLKKAAS